MKKNSFDIRKLFKKTKKEEYENVFDLVEHKIEKEKIKRKIKQNSKAIEKNSSENGQVLNSKVLISNVLNDTSLDNTIPEDVNKHSYNWNSDIIKTEIINFTLDDTCVYDFGNNQIRKIAKIEEYDLKIPFVSHLEEDTEELEVKIKVLDRPERIPDVLSYSRTLCDYEKILFLEEKIHLKNKEITKEIWQTLLDLEDLELSREVCMRIYEKLIYNGELIEELFTYKRDIRVLDKLIDKTLLSEEYLIEYAIFLNKSLINMKDCKLNYCSCSSCVVCKLISQSKFQELASISKNASFYKLHDIKQRTFDEILKLKFDLLTKNMTDITFYYVFFGFTEDKLLEFLKQEHNWNVYTRAICLLMKNTNKTEVVDSIDVIIEAYDKVHSLLCENTVNYHSFSLIEQIDFYYKNFNKINFDFLKSEITIKELVRHFKIKTSLLNLKIESLVFPFTFSNNLFLSYGQIFILMSIFKCKSRLNNLIYDIYDKMSKFIVPFSFYEELFQNQNDFTLYFIRAKELFKMFQLTHEKTFLGKCLKYIDKKTNEMKFKDKIFYKDKIFKMKLLKSKILLNIHRPIEAYYEIQRYKNIDVCKTLSYSNLMKSIDECDKLIKNSKDEKILLLLLELQVALKEGLEIGILFTKDSVIDETIMKNYLTHCDSTYEVQLVYIRYLKYRNLLKAHEFIENLLKKKIKYNENIYYESFIVKRKLGLVSYRVLYYDRNSDLLNQEINYIENKDCDSSNVFLYLFLHKKIKKEGKGDKEHLNYFFKEAIKGNGDCLVILYILYEVSEEYLLILKILHQIDNGFYWSRTRKIIDFHTRLEHTIEIFNYDQNY